MPRFKPERWEFRVFGATADGGTTGWNHEEFAALPYATVVADLHCVTKFSMLGVEWGGVTAAAVAKLAPPAADVTHVMVWAEYGYSANLRIEDFLDDRSIFATHKAGEPLTAEHGFPVRLVVPRLYAWKGPKWVRGVEYMTADRRGFWEERGYHNIGDPWARAALLLPGGARATAPSSDLRTRPRVRRRGRGERHLEVRGFPHVGEGSRAGCASRSDFSRATSAA